MKNDRKIWFILPLRCVMFTATFSACGLIAQKPLTEITNWWTIIASAINIVTVFVLHILCRRGNTTYCRMIHLDKNKKSLFKGFLFISAMLLIGMGGMYLAGLICYGEFPYLAPMMIEPINPCIAVVNIFILPLTTTIAEDGLYLGYGVNGFGSKRAAVLIPAFFYALQHSFIPTIFDVKFIVYRFLSFLPLTLWICFKYYKGSSVSYIMAGHWLLNMATTVQIAVTSFNPEGFKALTGV